MARKLTTEIFTEKSIVIHGNTYDYSLVDYINSKSNVVIICRIHGEFAQRPQEHWNGSGCPKCGLLKISNKNSSNTTEFVEKSIVIHENTYDYSLVNYINARNKVVIICPIHGEFAQQPTHHLNGHGCEKCGNIKKGESKIANLPGFKVRGVEVHGNRYDYSLVIYTKNHNKIKIKCNRCGCIFLQTPGNHLQGIGCPKCNFSKGEKKIAEFLADNKIKFASQYRFKKSVVSVYPYDFYLPELNIIIEYQGEQHYSFNKHFHRTQFNFIKRIHTDLTKKIYCRENGIEFIEIKYDENTTEKLMFLV